MTNSISYYDNNADFFISGTVDVDMRELYSRFLCHIPTGGHILDAGCGSGRDAKYFLDQGYQITAIDGSREMVAAASELIGSSVHQLLFDEILYQQKFDGIWACASVLHVKKNAMVETINTLGRALKKGGAFYLSYKYSDSEEVREDGRFFSNYTEASFMELLSKCQSLQLLELWTTADVRPDRQNELWLNALLKKKNR